MKKVIALVLCALIAVALVGCSGGSSSDGVVGTWKEVVPEEEIQELLDTYGDAGQEVIDGLTNSYYEFKNDGTLVFHSAALQQDFSGTYTIEGNKITIDLEGQELSLDIDGNTMKLNGTVVMEKQ